MRKQTTTQKVFNFVSWKPSLNFNSTFGEWQYQWSTWPTCSSPEQFVSKGILVISKSKVMNFWCGFLNVKIQNYSSGNTDSLGPSPISAIIRTGSSCICQAPIRNSGFMAKIVPWWQRQDLRISEVKPVLFHSERWSNCNALHLGNQIILVNAAFHDSKKFENTFQYSPFDLLTNEITSVSRKLKINVINSTSHQSEKSPNWSLLQSSRKKSLPE